MLKTRELRYGSLAPLHGRTASWKQGWRSINGLRIFFRSRWEFNYALYLELLRTSGQIHKWEHEPKTFWFDAIKRGCRSYLPDFCVTLPDGAEEYHEVKGWMDPRSITKLKRMKKYHPAIVIKLIDAAWFKANRRTLSQVIPGWET